MSVAAILLAFTTTALSLVRLPYYTISPGDAFDVRAQVTVSGESVDDTSGEVLLLFVRQRSQVNGWRYIQAKLDDDIDLLDEEAIAGGLPPQDYNALNEAQMLESQLHAKKVALETLGFDVPEVDGVLVLGTFPGAPAEAVLEPKDVIVEANGTPLASTPDLFEVMDDVAPGEDVELSVRREGEETVVTVGTEEQGNTGRAVMGVVPDRHPAHEFPVDIEIDTGSISGPSAGLAMTISVLDALSPADLTGGLVVAATGEIGPDGEVLVIGGIGQKTVSARANGADLMLVPEGEIEEARARAKGLKVVGVADIDDALAALEAAGGEPLAPPNVGELAA